MLRWAVNMQTALVFVQIIPWDLEKRRPTYDLTVTCVIHAKCWHLCWLLMLDPGSDQQPFPKLPVQAACNSLPYCPTGADLCTCVLPLSIKGFSNSHKHRVDIVVQLRAGILAAHHNSQLVVVCCSLMLPCVFIHQTMLSMHCHPLVLPEIQPARSGVTETVYIQHVGKQEHTAQDPGTLGDITM